MISIDGRAIRIIKANSGDITFVFYNADNEALDLSEYTVTFVVKQKKDTPDTTTIIERTFSGISGSQVTVSLVDNDTNNDVGAYWWSVKLSNGDYKNEVLSGPFFIISGVQE